MKTNTLKTVTILLGLLSAQALCAQADNQVRGDRLQGTGTNHRAEYRKPPLLSEEQINQQAGVV